MKNFKDFVTENYDEDYDKAMDDFAHLKSNGYSQVARDIKPDKPTRYGFEGRALEKKKNENTWHTHRGQIYFDHNNFTRKHNNIKSTFGYVQDEATEHSRPRVVTHTAEHKTIKAAVKHLERLYKEHK